ncbi:hypothetical protein PAECIP111893_00309 [Paenibacillus plantiphilus]|uniref:Uncharacterized protein n=1 Tax=Paenibacillus plantiphilus TaxID=2905650 RepID=A0ABM9BQA3_9BACL|nr:hypothetical protein [Paenibacillus plantiphilus]CAH1190392.1 hypothetical protein PAECIP111893_00309 [Paenibacillus plantiphilus]
MGIESYNFLLYPKKNKATLADDGWETYGDDSILFSTVTDVLLSLENVAVYAPINKWPTNDPECYFSYVDESSIIEIEINSGEKTETVKELSLRFAICNPEGIFEKALELCENISGKLDLNVLNMKLHEVLDFNNDIQMERSKKIFSDKREKFFSIFGLPLGVISQPLYCGEVYEVLRGKK